MLIGKCSYLVFRTTRRPRCRIAQHCKLFGIHWSRQRQQRNHPKLQCQNYCVGLPYLTDYAMCSIRDRRPKLGFGNLGGAMGWPYLRCFESTSTVEPTNCEDITIIGYYWDSTSTWSHWCDLSPNSIFWAIKFGREETLLTIETTSTIYSEVLVDYANESYEEIVLPA